MPRSVTPLDAANGNDAHAGFRKLDRQPVGQLSGSHRIGHGRGTDQLAVVNTAQGFERMERAYTAPRSIVTDKAGKPVGMKIG